MKKLKKIMLFAAVLSSLPVSVCNAVNANQYLSADMFANTLNMIGTDENAGLTSSGSFFSNPDHPDCSTANLSVGFPAERVQAGSTYCLKLSDIVSGNSSVAESFSYSSLHPVLSSVPFDGSNIRKTVKYDCGSGTDAECYSISGYPTAAMALANIIELADEDGKVLDSLAIPNKRTVRVDGYAVIHVRQFSMRAASRLISNPEAGGVILLVDDFADIEGNPKKCVFSVNDPSKIDMADGCAFIYGAYIMAGGKITADSVAGDFYRRCGDGDCRTFVTQSYRAAGEQEVSITPAMTRFSAPVIEISNSLIGGYTGNWNFSSSETSNYTVTIPTQLVTCERGEIRITSSSAAAVNVDINLDGVARFADDGSVSKSVSVSSNSPQTLEVVSAGSGKTVVSLGEPYVCVSSDCSFEFVDSALRFYKKAGTAPDSVFTAPDSVFYAGKEQQLYVAAVSSTTGGQCTFSRLSGKKITLKAHKPGGAGSVLVKYSDQNTVVVDKNGRDLILDEYSDGFYQLPVFTYNDAGEFILSASGKIEVSTDNSTDALQGASDALSGDTRFTASPYAVYIDLSSGPCQQCHPELGEKYDSGKDVSLKYIPKAWCKEITEKVVDGARVVTADDALAGCPTADSFAGTGETDPAVYAVPHVPHGQEPGVSSQNYLHTRTLEWKTAGSRNTVNQIDNTGRFDFMIDSFKDPASGLTVHRTVRQNVDGYFAPWAFAVQFAPGETYAVANACVNTATGRHSFTYFAQPFPLRMKVVARTANNLDATLFDEKKYKNAAKYFPQFAAFSPLGEKLVDADSVSRLSDCGSEKPVWKDGKLTFSDYYLKLLPSGTKSSDYGKLPTRDYRGEAPSYNVAAAENARLSAFTVSLGMQMGVSLNTLTTKHHEMDYDGSYNEPSSIYYSAERKIEHGTDTYLKLFGPLDLRMGRIVLENARANPGKTMYLPLKMQYFSQIKSNNEVVSAGEWIDNTDDSCTRLGRQNFYVSSYLNQSEILSNLKNSGTVKYDDLHSSVLELVSERTAKAEARKEIVAGVEDQYAVAGNGVMYLRISSPSPPSLPVMFMVHTASVTEKYSGTVPSHLTPLSAYETKNPLTAKPVWFGISQESRDHAFGAFRAWPGNDRVLYRINPY